MKYSTTCTQCASVFRLTPEQLDAAQGWAQCGVCGAPFNARSTLAAENGDPLPVDVSPPPPVEASAPETPSSVAIARHDTAPAIPEASPPDEPDAISSELASIPQLAGIENRAGGPDLSSIILIDPDAEEVTDDYGPLPDFSTKAQDGTSTPTSIYGPAYSAPPAAKPNLPSQVVMTDVRAEPVNPVTLAIPSKSHWPTIIWAFVSLLLVLALALQLGYFLRDMIALKVPVTRPWIEAACAKIGCSLSLPKDAALIQIIGSDLQAEPAGAGHLQLKITLGNRAAYAQAWPVLVLTLTDRTDQPQARRSFAPSEYLSDSTLLASGIPAQSEHQLSLPLEVRNQTLAGYRLAITY